MTVTTDGEETNSGGSTSIQGATTDEIELRTWTAGVCMVRLVLVSFGDGVGGGGRSFFPKLRGGSPTNIGDASGNEERVRICGDIDGGCGSVAEDIFSGSNDGAMTRWVTRGGEGKGVRSGSFAGDGCTYHGDGGVGSTFSLVVAAAAAAASAIARCFARVAVESVTDPVSGARGIRGRAVEDEAVGIDNADGEDDEAGYAA